VGDQIKKLGGRKEGRVVCGVLVRKPEGMRPLGRRCQTQILILRRIFATENGGKLDVHESMHRDIIMKVTNKMQL
jgi:hypothetical protein